MAGGKKQLIRATISVDKEDYAALGLIGGTDGGFILMARSAGRSSTFSTSMANTDSRSWLCS